MPQPLHVLTYSDRALGQRVRTGASQRREEDSLRLCCAYPLINNADAGDWTAAERFEVLPQIFSTSRVYMRTEGVVHTSTNGMLLFVI